MSDRAKQITAAIIADVWPGDSATFVSEIVKHRLESAVEKHLLRPHQVRDADGNIWEQNSTGGYCLLMLGKGLSMELVQRTYGPLTEVQGEPLLNVSEIERLKEDRMSMIETAARLRGLCDNQKNRIAELEKQISMQPASQPEPIWQLMSEDVWVYGVPVSGAVQNYKADVYFNGRKWSWYLTDRIVRGEADSFDKAIDEAEKAMGVK